MQNPTRPITSAGPATARSLLRPQGIFSTVGLVLPPVGEACWCGHGLPARKCSTSTVARWFALEGADKPYAIWRELTPAQYRAASGSGDWPEAVAAFDTYQDWLASPFAGDDAPDLRPSRGGVAKPQSPETKALIAEASRYLAECEGRKARHDDMSPDLAVPDFILTLLADPKRGTKWFRITENMARAIVRTRDAEQAAKAKAAERASSQPRLPEVIRWLGDEAARSDFASSLLHGLSRYGSLTQNQYDAVVRSLDRSPREPRQTSAATSPEPVAEDGWYKVGETIYKVQKAVHGSGHLYAKRLVVTGPGEATWEYEAGMVRRLSAADRLTPEAAAAFGALYGCCAVCGRTLTDEGSQARGIGPVCAGRLA